MKFFAVALAAFAAGVAAQYEAPDNSACSIVTITETVTYGQTIPVPGPSGSSSAVAIPPYPTGPAYNPGPGPSGTGVYSSTTTPEGTAAPTGAPTGTGVYTATPPEFTGGAAAMKAAGALAGVGAVAAFFL